MASLASHGSCVCVDAGAAGGNAGISSGAPQHGAALGIGDDGRSMVPKYAKI